MTSPYPDLNFGDIYDAIATSFADDLALVYGDTSYSWAELDGRSNRLARSLTDAGLEPGSKVAFYLKNSPAYVELWMACCKGRFIHCNINYRYVERELFYLLENSDAEAVAYDAAFRPQVQLLRSRLPKVKAWLEFGSAEPLPFADSFSEICETGDNSPLELTRSGDDMYFMYTGGTTGHPKAVMWRMRDRIAATQLTNAQNMEEHLQWIKASTDPWITLPAAPMMHSTGLSAVMATLLRAGTLVILPSKGFDPQTCINEISSNRVTRLSIVGDAFSVPLLEFLRNETSLPDLSSMEVISSSGAMWSDHLKQELLEYFPQATLSDGLGSTEGPGLGKSTTRRDKPGKTARFSIGPNVKVFREDLTEIEPGSNEVGMIGTTGPLPIGYYKDPDKTKETYRIVNGARYAIAGDWCRIDEEGNLILLGRGSHCINTGGEKVFPEEVEEVLMRIPLVLDAAVLGIADDRWGQAVAAVLRTTDGKSLDEKVIRHHLDQGIARYKHPRHITYVDSGFRQDNGKIDYDAARRLLDVYPGVTSDNE